MEATREKLWLYSGSPEYVDILVKGASPAQGGYIIGLYLTDGTLRLAASCQPAKYIATWRNNARRYGLPDVVRVLISGPHLRYEAIKRVIAAKLAEHKEKGSDAYRLDIVSFAEKVSEVFSAAKIGPCSAQS